MTKTSVDIDFSKDMTVNVIEQPKDITIERYGLEKASSEGKV